MANIFQRFFGVFQSSAANAEKGNPLENPANPISAETLGALGAGNSLFPVDEQTALEVTSFFRAVTILSGVIASLPISVFEINKDESVKRRRTHAITRLLNIRPSESITRYNFFQTMVLHLLTFGNFYALISRSAASNGLATSMQILNPSQMTVKTTKAGRVVYEYRWTDGSGAQTQQSTTYAADRIVHISGLSWDGIRGIGIVDTFAGVLGTALANQSFIESFYGRGAFISGVVSVDGKLNDEAYKRMVSSWQSAYAGSANAGKTAILEQGAKYSRVGLTPTDAGYTDTKKSLVADIARITGVPQFLLEDLDRATFNNIEELSKLFVTYTLKPLCFNIASELAWKLLPESEKINHEIKFDFSEILGADVESQSKLIDSLMKWGVANRDEVRRTQGMPPIEDGSGKAYYIPMNMMDPTKEPEDAETPETAQNTDDDEEETPTGAAQ